VKYTEDYRTALMELIEEKIAGNNRVTTIKNTPSAPSNVTDLISALQASLDTTKKKMSNPRKQITRAKTS